MSSCGTLLLRGIKKGMPGNTVYILATPRDDDISPGKNPLTKSGIPQEALLTAKKSCP